ncbi:MAG: AAA family ATPase [Candidatus Eisenbacteria bacterium]|nr:AAA family ATPase [Candidatus Eisenbacteria bacterium]
MVKKVIGAVGKNASGKDTVLDILAKHYGVPLISMGDIVRDIAHEKGIEPTRESLNEISRSHFEKHGPDYFIKTVIDRIDASGAPFTVVAGIRTYLDAKSLRDRYGRDFLLIHVVVSDDTVRMRRATERGTPRDPKTMEELHEHDAREERIFGIEKAATLATSRIANDDGLAELEEKVERWVAENLPGLAGKGGSRA